MMAAPSPLHVCVVEWANTDILAPSVWVGTNLDYVARASAISMYARMVNEHEDDDLRGLAHEVGEPRGLAYRDVLEWHVVVHEGTTAPWATFYYASVEGGEAVGASGWLTGISEAEG